MSLDCPLLEELNSKLDESDCNVYWGIILTNQQKWAKSKYESTYDDWVWSLVASDGYWGQYFLQEWFKSRENMHFCPLNFEVETDIKHGAANWEVMADKIEFFLQEYITVKHSKIVFNYPNISEEKNIDKIILFLILG